MLTKYCLCDSDYICKLLEERSMLERVLGTASKADKLMNERKRAKLISLLEGIKNNHEEVMAELELLRKDDVKVSLLATDDVQKEFYNNVKNVKSWQ